MIKLEGNIRKMRVEYNATIQYALTLSDQFEPLNQYIGSHISLEWNSVINCVQCGNQTKKSFFQGFCYPCFIQAPESSECILKPELCKAQDGIARDMEWAKDHCLKDHYPS